MLGIAEVLKSVQEQLSELSGTHHADTTPHEKLDNIVKRLKAWEAGSNVDPGGGDGTAPIVAISATAGVAIASADSLLLGAQTQIDVISAGTAQVSTGKTFLVRAAEAVSIFAHKLGLKLIAAAGKMELQTHKDDIEVTSARRLVLSAADEIVLQAPNIRFRTKGAQLDIGNGEILQQCGGNFTIKSAKFAQMTGGGGEVADMKFPNTDVKTDERIVLFDSQTGQPVQNRGYRAILEDGQVFEGKTDAEGRTAVMQSSVIGEIQIVIDAHGD